MDSELLNGSNMKALPDLLAKMREHCVETNKKYADILDIPSSAAISCVKPSGTVSQLVDSASGIHPRYSKYYIRRVRADKKDPLADFMIQKGYVAEEDFYSKSNWVFSFPMKAPEGAVFTKDVTAIQQLELWKVYQDHWCEHKPSITVYVGEDEWMDVGAWVYRNISCLSGVSFLPRDTGTYRQAPYEEIDEKKYNELMSTQKVDIKWTEFMEETDTTEGVQNLACTAAGGCEI
jgi:ribonucleoside-diphosphate reductase alpha chain